MTHAHHGKFKKISGNPRQRKIVSYERRHGHKIGAGHSTCLLKKTVVKSLFAILGTLIFLLGGGTVTHASGTYSYKCADWTTDTPGGGYPTSGDVTCNDTTNAVTGTYPGSGGYDLVYDAAGAAYTMTTGTYYLSFDTTQSATRFVCTGTGSCGDTTVYGSQRDYPISATGYGLGIDFALSNSSMNGTLSNICISDTIGVCDTGSEPQYGFQEVFPLIGSTTPPTQNVVIADIPTLDLALGFLLFYASAYMTIKLLRPRL